MPFFLRTSIIKRYSRRGRRPRRPQACSWLSLFCDAAHHRVVGDADPYDPKIKNCGSHRSPLPGTTLSTDYSLSAATRRPEKMTLGDSVNIVKGHFHSVLVSNILVTSLSVGSDPFVHTMAMQNLYLLGGFFEGLFWLLLSWEPWIYLYIGITSLYLYITTADRLFQDGIFHKSTQKLVCKTQIPLISPFSR